MLVEKLLNNHILEFEEFLELLHNQKKYVDELLYASENLTNKYFNKKIFVRGLIEFSNVCKNDCYYCGIRASNDSVSRYRLSKEEILDSVRFGTDIGFNTFVLQGGEDLFLSDEFFVDVIREIKRINPNTAITLSLGEKSYESLKAFKKAGADRFLLRQETINKEHYYKLHPNKMNYENRIECLRNLKSLGYQTGTGIMVGSPYQTMENIVEDLIFMSELKPEMIGIGPYISQKDTPFKDMDNGSVELTIYLIAILRLMFPKSNIPATTSLVTLDENGRNRAIKAGANVFMPNLTPSNHRNEYALYDNKAAFKVEAAENLEELKKIMSSIGYEVVMSRGDYVGW